MSAYNKADSRQHRYKYQKPKLIMRKNSIESKAYVKLIQPLERRKVYKSWDEKGIFALVEIDAELTSPEIKIDRACSDQNECVLMVWPCCTYHQIGEYLRWIHKS